MASGKAKAPSSWAAVMCVGAGTAEALKDRHAVLSSWNHAFRSVQQRASSTAAAGNSMTKAAPTVGGAVARRKARREQEEELRTVMYLSNWGPNN